jgi:hypothetical protein
MQLLFKDVYNKLVPVLKILFIKVKEKEKEKETYTVHNGGKG